MSDPLITRMEQSIKHLQGLDRPEQQYNCDCQNGGVDAMSVDTDWLLHNINEIAEVWGILTQMATWENL